MELRPRDYQVDLFERALEQNVIVWLETGAGKTFIALLLLKELASATTGPFQAEKGGKRSAFLVCSVALAKQQSSYIEKNTCLKTKCFTGEMNVDSWTKSKWMEELNSCQVMVMTHQVLVNVLLSGCITFENLNLIIFDECHHADKNHPYKVIMQHYSTFKSNYPQLQPPRILGLTACLFSKSKKATTPAAMRNQRTSLERTFFAKVVTSPFDSSEFSAKPDIEIVEAKDGRPESFLSHDSFQLLREKIESFERLQETADKTVASDLRHCFEVLGLRALSLFVEVIINTRNQNSADDFLQYKTLSSEAVLSLKDLQLSLDEVHAILLGEYDERSFFEYAMSPKVARLFALLKISMRQHRDDQFCGIIFVERRYSAAVLHKMIQIWAQQSESLRVLKPVFMVGKASGGMGARISQREQNEALDQFRKGNANLLVATSVIEEGIDVPHCNFVCKFDLPQNFRSYVQSKGRARARNSKFVMLAASAEYIDFNCKMQYQFKPMEDFIVSDCFDRSVPTDQECFSHHEELLLQPYEPFDYPGAPKVTRTSALSLLYRYCQTLPADKFTNLAPIFETKPVTAANDSFVSKIRMPTVCAIKEPIVGCVQKSEHAAKVSAALVACRMLHEAGELDDRLLPRRLKKKGKSEQERKAFSEKGNVLLEWLKCQPLPLRAPIQPRQHLFLYKVNHIVIDNTWMCDYMPEFLRCSSMSTGFLAPRKLPSIPMFLIYSLFGTEMVSLEFIKEVFISQPDFSLACEVHDWVFSEILKVPNVQFDVNASVFQLLTVFLDNNGNLQSRDQLIQLSASCDWNNAVVKLPRFDTQKEKDRLRFVEQLDTGQVASIRSVGDDIDYSTKARTRKSTHRLREKVAECEKQCFTTELLHHVLCLPTMYSRISSLVACECLLSDIMAEVALGQELLCRSIRDDVLMAEESLIVPSFYECANSESIMNSLKHRKVIDKEIQLAVGPVTLNLLRSITLKSAHSGDGLNLERQEVLGDAFLKFSVSRYLFCTHPKMDEGDLTNAKGKIISNSALAERAKKKGIESVIISQKLQPRVNWLPPLFVPTTETLSSTRELTSHSFVEKSVADVVEALIGCFLDSCSEQLALEVMHKYLDIPVLLDSVNSFQMDVGITSKHSQEWIADDYDTLIANLDVVEHTLNYTFRNKLLLVEALTHPSYSRNTLTDSYQRLEFLGDALLDWLVTRHIYRKYPEFDPGKVTDMRSALVNNVLLSSLAVKLGLHKSLKHLSHLLSTQINGFVEFVLEDSSLLGNGAECVELKTFSELENLSGDDGSDDPKPLGDCVESVAAAIYLDCGQDPDTVWTVFYPHLKSTIEKFARKIPKHPTRELCELFTGQNVPVYDEVLEEISVESVDELVSSQLSLQQHTKCVRVKVNDRCFEGKANNLKDAKRRASKKALEFFTSQPIDDL